MSNEKRLPFSAKSNETETITATIKNDFAMPVQPRSLHIPKYNFVGWNYDVYPNVQEETKCKMVTDAKRGMIRIAEYNNGLHVNTADIMPDFSDIKIIKDQNGIERAVIVKFADGTEAKATLSGCDNYSLEQGISICVTKRLLDDKTFRRHGSATYNKIIRRALQVMHINEEERQKVADEYQCKEKRYAKLAEKKRKRNERRAAAHREAEIEMRKEAYLRAMRELQKENVE